MTNDQVGEIYTKLTSNISAYSNKIIETQNVIFQISTVEEQKNSDNPNISSIDLGDCEDRIKKEKGLEDLDLIVFKMDIKNEDSSSTYVQYEIYDPITLLPIPMEICEDLTISISVPMTLEQSIQSECDRLGQSGYNLFDLNDPFYKDICSTYTTENGKWYRSYPCR